MRRIASFWVFSLQNGFTVVEGGDIATGPRLTGGPLGGVGSRAPCSARMSSMAFGPSLLSGVTIDLSEAMVCRRRLSSEITLGS